ncbi:MAG: hypothetical protein M3400_12615 [Actinomycetota bacterium]|nr:hypothetical protein [Actinomycetota bacterium]
MGQLRAPARVLAGVHGRVNELEGPIHAPLGTGHDDPSFTLTHRQLARNERAILRAVSDSWREPLEDDGTVVVLCVG